MPRRVVTGLDRTEKPIIVSDSEPPRTTRHMHTPGFISSMLWASPAGDVTAHDPTEGRTFVPVPGETVALTITFPPSSVYQDPGFDFHAAADEQTEGLPSLAELFEPDGSKIHTTATVDYGVALDGTIVLDLDNGESTELRAGDIVVQNRTRHAWRYLERFAATVFFVRGRQGRQSLVVMAAN